jgi:hypothetical protein
MDYLNNQNLPWFVAKFTEQGVDREWGRFQQWNEETAMKVVKELFPAAENIVIHAWSEPLPKGQMELPLPRIEFQPFKAFKRAVKKALAPANAMLTSWKQIPLKLYVRKLVKKATGFLWTRPDGKQFFCPTMRSLVARIMDYDGHLLNGVLRMAKK